MRHAKRVAAGFTLLELLMVVIIVGILAALALPRYFRAAERSRGAEATSTLGTLRSAIQRACTENNAGTAPAGFANLDVEDPNTNPNRLWQYTFPTAIACGTNPVTITTFLATRNGGPCVNSTITLNDGPNVAQAFTYVWLGNCV